jgi:hypothetical protein
MRQINFLQQTLAITKLETRQDKQQHYNLTRKQIWKEKKQKDKHNIKNTTLKTQHYKQTTLHTKNEKNQTIQTTQHYKHNIKNKHENTTSPTNKLRGTKQHQTTQNNTNTNTNTNNTKKNKNKTNTTQITNYNLQITQHNTTIHPTSVPAFLRR